MPSGLALEIPGWGGKGVYVAGGAMIVLVCNNSCTAEVTFQRWYHVTCSISTDLRDWECNFREKAGIFMHELYCLCFEVINLIIW